MRFLVIYDITDDRIRLRVAEILLNYGCIRIQKSAFIGDLSRNKREELWIELERTLGENRGNIQMFSLCDKCFRSRREISVDYALAEDLLGFLTSEREERRGGRIVVI